MAKLVILVIAALFTIAAAHPSHLAVTPAVQPIINTVPVIKTVPPVIPVIISVPIVKTVAVVPVATAAIIAPIDGSSYDVLKTK